MLIIYNKPNIHSFPIITNRNVTKNQSNLPSRTISLMPGNNRIKDEDWNLLLKEYGKTIEWLEDEEQIEIMDDVDANSFVHLAKKEKFLLIRNTLSIDELEGYKLAEGKKGKIKADLLHKINEQIKALKAFDNKIKDEKDKKNVYHYMDKD